MRTKSAHRVYVENVSKLRLDVPDSAVREAGACLAGARKCLISRLRWLQWAHDPKVAGLDVIGVSVSGDMLREWLINKPYAAEYTVTPLFKPLFKKGTTV